MNTLIFVLGQAVILFGLYKIHPGLALILIGFFIAALPFDRL